jgi:outer membrane protein assembly factor BamB
VIWATEDMTGKSAYCNPILVERGGKKIIITMTAAAVVGVEAAKGEVLWQDLFTDYIEKKPSDTNPVSPLYHDGWIYTTSGYNDGSCMLELSADGTSVTRKWTDETMDCHHGNVVLVDGYIYGSNFLSNTRGKWVCQEWETGKIMYETTWHNKGSVIYADGMLYCYEDNEGYLALVKPDPTEFKPVSFFQITQGNPRKHWAHPVIADGRLYIRHNTALMAYDIKAK